MNTITLKDVPPALHKSLKARARENGRSLNREVLVTLENALRSKPFSAENIATRAKALREEAGIYVTQPDLISLKNKGRS